MILRFAAKNFRSLRDDQELSLIGTEAFKNSASDLIKREGIPGGVLRCAAIFGANASGKTNVLNAIKFMIDCIRDSQSKWSPQGEIPRTPFLLDESRDQPSCFRLDFVFEDTRFEYGFTIDSAKVLEEYLDAWIPGGRKAKWFDRKANQKIDFGKRLTGENRTIESLTRENSLFLSAAAQNNHAMLLPLYTWLTTRIRVLSQRVGLNVSTVKSCVVDPQIKERVLALLTTADLGIVDFELKEEAVGSKDPFINALRKAIVATAKDFPPGQIAFPEKIETVRLLHKTKGGQPVPLSIAEESSGTSAYLGLLGPCLETLTSGGLICIDEFNASLHPLLATRIVHLFNSPVSNPNGAQLVFNTHDTNLLRRTTLRRDQIWFTEKDEEGATHLYPLSDFKTRQHQNVEKGYLEGRYGAIPFVDEEDLLNLASEGE
jgi:AAA15 family ATPase/GTPase